MRIIWLFIFTNIVLISFGQTSDEELKKPITYYLPDINYNKNITTPEEFFGFQIGEWHISHDQANAYVKHLAAQSPYAEVQTYAKSHEKRQLLVLYISNEKNLASKSEIKKRHNELTENPNASIDNLPLILYQGYSIHGNEPSGINAAILTAYYLIAGESNEVRKLRDECFIILDPCYNPDGVQRFSNWVNSHKSVNLTSDGAGREYNEIWPGGRTNHYWFDLNRDWLLLTHPESRGRVKLFQEWKPNILTDHHEMGTNSTFFFQPGVPSRVNPNTPWKNQELTEEIANYHAEALDAIGSLYYSKEGFDDFYYGKGSTYPDIHGGIGILFEQASSRGHYQESKNGILTFPFTIRNQVATSLSTQKAALAMKKKLLEYKRDFYKEAANKAQGDPVKAYIVYDEDIEKLKELFSILMAHEVKIYETTKNISVNGIQYPQRKSYVIPTEQKQYKIVKTCFEKVRQFQDSIFYDVSTWTLPLAFDVQYDELDKSKINGLYNQNKALDQSFFEHYIPAKLSQDDLAVVFDWNQAYAPAMLNDLLDINLIVKTLSTDIKTNSEHLKAGTIILPLNNQTIKTKELIEKIEQLIKKHKINIKSLKNGKGEGGFSLGHPSIRTLNKIKPFMIVGSGVSSYDAGEIWHYMDHRLMRNLTLVDKNDLNKLDLARYTTLVMVEGSYNDLSESFLKKLESWIQKGGNVVALSNSVEFLKSKNLIKTAILEDKTNIVIDSYGKSSESKGAQVVGGAIFDAIADVSHPLCFGLADKNISLFKQGSTLYKVTENNLATPLRYGKCQSGYTPKGFEERAKGTAAAMLFTNGNGNIVCFPDNIVFRGYWWGGFRLFANALFMTSIIDSDGKEKM